MSAGLLVPRAARTGRRFSALGPRHKMARAAFFVVCAVFFMGSSLSVNCCLPPSIQAEVPGDVPAGFAVLRVNLGPCGSEDLQVATDDPDFSAQTDGTVIASRFTVVSAEGRRFLIWVQKKSGEKSQVEVTLIPKAKEAPSNLVLRRNKRRWSPPPVFIKENNPPPFPCDTEVIASDSSQNYTVYYIISGPGVTERPANMFSINPQTGMVRVHGPLDREEFPNITFVARVFSLDTQKQTDEPLPVTVIVEDVNDNAPDFTEPMQYTVMEHSRPGTPVGIVKATDRDDPTTLHTKIRYKLLGASGPFSIDSLSGAIVVRTLGLDREVLEKHLIPVEIRDMDGAPHGLFRTGMATIALGDINDNPPTFRQTSYSAQIQENKANVLILRIPVDDKDLVNTDNWKSRFVITKGNESGIFRIDTDPTTNEGLLYINKPLDYEKTKNVILEVSAQNVAKLEGTTATWASVPVNVNVTNVDEGPEFNPGNLHVLVKENVPNGTLIATYMAIDPDTQSSKGIRYYKLSDPASWINVEENSGVLKVANTIDRESSFVTNGIYNITVQAVDESKKTGTGTVIIQIEDVNDNTPEIMPSQLILCETGGESGSVIMTARDLDQPPFSAPFSFQLGQNNDEKWKLEKLNDTAAVLRPAVDLPTGVYSVPVMVKDLQGVGKEQMVTVQICRCVGGACLAARSSTSLGVWGVLAMALAAFLLLLLCLLFALVCSTKKEKIDMDDASDGMLLKSNTEGPGDEVNTSPPFSAVDGSMLERQESNFSKMAAGNMNMMGMQQETTYQTLNSNMVTGDTMGRYGTGNSNMVTGDTMGRYGTGNFGSIKEETEFLGYATRSSVQTWKTNGLYLDKKLMYFAKEDSSRYAGDIPLRYGYEGCGSPAGSVGCCSELGADDGLGFLDSLGPKFRTLAEVCKKK